MTYDRDGKRRAYTDSVMVRTFIWDGENIVRQSNREYTHNPQQYGELISQGGDPGTYYHHYDALGSTMQMTDGDEAVCNEYVYRAFGEHTDPSGENAAPNRFRWVGKLGYYFEADLNTYWLRARVYEPARGRFISRDPVRDEANVYRWPGNSPVVQVDPSGMQWRRFWEKGAGARATSTAGALSAEARGTGTSPEMTSDTGAGKGRAEAGRAVTGAIPSAGSGPFGGGYAGEHPGQPVITTPPPPQMPGLSPIAPPREGDPCGVREVPLLHKGDWKYYRCGVTPRKVRHRPMPRVCVPNCIAAQRAQMACCPWDMLYVFREGFKQKCAICDMECRKSPDYEGEFAAILTYFSHLHCVNRCVAGFMPFSPAIFPGREYQRAVRQCAQRRRHNL